MGWLKAFALNIIALILAAGIGTVATSQVIYVLELQTGAMPIAPLFRGFFVSLIVAMIAPRTKFWPKFLVFTGIYLLELALSVVATAAAVDLLNAYFNGDLEAAKPWTYFGAVISLTTGIAGYCTLRLCRAQAPKAPTVTA